MDPRQLAEIHRNRAKRLYEEGRVKDAVLELENCIGADPRDAEGWQLLAEIYGAAGYIEQAASYIQKCLKENYQNTDGWVMLANLYSQLGGPYLDLALQQLDLAMSLDDNHANAHYLRGNILAQKGNYERAIESLQRALSIQPEHPYARHDLEALKARA
ncbi:MAG: tetratricopeptide repeat protein [Candidatus Eremiobacterota bacterium]